MLWGLEGQVEKRGVGVEGGNGALFRRFSKSRLDPGTLAPFAH